MIDHDGEGGGSDDDSDSEELSFDGAGEDAEAGARSVAKSWGVVGSRIGASSAAHRGGGGAGAATTAVRSSHMSVVTALKVRLWGARLLVLVLVM